MKITFCDIKWNGKNFSGRIYIHINIYTTRSRSNLDDVVLLCVCVLYIKLKYYDVYAVYMEFPVISWYFV